MAQWSRIFLSLMAVLALVISLSGCSEDEAGCLEASCEETGTENNEGGDSDSDETSTSGPGSSDPIDRNEEDTEVSDDDCSLASWQPLYKDSEVLEPHVQEHREDALITRLADRARDRHAREDIVNGVPFQAYDHYLSFYWEQRVANIEIIDRVAKGGSDITVNFMTLDQLNPAEFRTFYGNSPSVALYHNNMSDSHNQGVTLVSVTESTDYPGETEYTYTANLTNQFPENRPLVMGDRIEIELSQFLLAPRNGRTNYYGTALLYVVGEGIVPWYAKEKEESSSPAQRAQASFDSYALPEHAWLGGWTTLSYHYSNEPDHRFKQMAGNISWSSGHPFMHGRRLHHTNFSDGSHSESGNPVFEEHAGKVGPAAVAPSCVSCHLNNGRDVPPDVGQPVSRAVVKVAANEEGLPHEVFGDSLQPLGVDLGGGESLLKVEAESYVSASGVQSESTTDAGGGLNMGYLDSGDSMSYEPVMISESGSYVFAARVASLPGGGSFLLTGPGGTPVYAEVNVPSTGGWQNWTTVSTTIYLNSGEYPFDIVVEDGGWNINWFEILELEMAEQSELPVILSDYEWIEGAYGDGEPFLLRKPLYSFEGEGPQFFSVRLAPPLVGLGLLEAVDETTLEALADPCDENGDGISGRYRVVERGDGSEANTMGRFGYKSSTPGLVYQVAAALNRDMGVTTSIYPFLDGETSSGDAGPELNDQDLELMRRYVSLLGVPARRDLTDEEALRGEVLFQEAGCESCHKSTLSTGTNHPYAELREQTIHPFTDMLLHDLGDGLADSLNEANVLAREWRTAPLWGIGLTAGVSGAEAYLHDGRAQTLAEAILWHGGEALSAKENFRMMAAADRAALVKFLKSL